MNGRCSNGRRSGTPGSGLSGGGLSESGLSGSGLSGGGLPGGGGRGVLPLGVQTFSEVRGSGDYYVDKTAFAYRMATEGKCYFLSRPRRFGKSLFVSMLKELFEGNEGLFEGLFVHDRWDWSVCRPVVRLSFGSGFFTEPGGLKADLADQLGDIEARWGLRIEKKSLTGRFRRLLEELHQRSGRRAVVLVDEYDKPILDTIGSLDRARANRDFLRGFYAAVKDADEHLRFVFLTGVSKFSKVSLFSGLNNLKDITINPVYSSVCGFTESDLDRVFSTELEGLDRDLVREWYNGYSWLGPEKVYNPYDVLMLLDEREFKAHWFETASPTFLVDTLIERGAMIPALDGMIAGERLLSSFDVGRITTEALLFQTGYLTITGTQQQGNKTLYELSYPNSEVRESLNDALLEQLVGPEVFPAVNGVRLLDVLRTGDTQGLRDLFDGFFASIPYQWHATGRADKYEAYYASVFYTYFTACGFDVRVEDATSRGRVDMAAFTPEYIWLFEFKTTRHNPKGAALQQIHDRDYADKYRIHGLPVILVGIEFDIETRSIAKYHTTTIQPRHGNHQRSLPA